MRKNCRVIKAILIITLIAAFLFGGCSSVGTVDRNLKVTIVDSLFFEVETPAAAVKYGEDFSTVLYMRSGYTFSSCDYANHSASENADGSVTLTLKNVTRPLRVTVKSEKRRENQSPVINVDCSVNYYLNGGQAEGIEGDPYSVNYTLTSHFRLNTWNGVGLERKGYTLYGWNTQPDGSGEHVGLGSRVTVAQGKKLILYAEWLEQIDQSLFVGKEIAPGECALTGYRGKDGGIEPFVLPSEIDGKKVTEISGSFTTNMKCGKITAKTLVLPNTVKRVRGNSFVNSEFSEICFSDNIEEIDEKAFPYNLKTYRINAYLKPCFQNKNNSTIFSDNMDRLILNADKRKMIFFSGCSFAYGLNGKMVDDEWNGEYVVFNMGMNGDINGAFQMEIILNYMRKGDVFIHSPEEMSPSQLMCSFFVNNVVFIMTEGNYDLLTLADFSENGGVLRAFFDYIALKRETEPCSYSDGVYENFDEYGDYLEARPYDEETESERDVTYSDDVYCYEPDLLADRNIAKLASYYDRAKDKGSSVFLSYAPVNISAREEGEIYKKGIKYAAKWEEMMADYGYYSISNVEDYMFLGRYFYDSDYHLNELGADLRTERLIADLRAAGV